MQLALWVGAICIVGWYVAAECAEWLALSSERARAALQGSLLGAALGGGLVVLEVLLLDPSLFRTPARWGGEALRGAVVGLVFGTVGLLAAAAAYAGLGHAPWARGLSWGVLGLATGLTEGFKAASARRARAAGVGAGVGGLLGGWVVEQGPEWAGPLSASPEGAVLVMTMGLAALGVCLGAGMGLAQVLTRRARLIVLTSPLGKQLGLAFDIGSVAAIETIGSLKATWTLTGDPGVLSRHLSLERRGGSLLVRPLGQAQVDRSDRPMRPDELGQLADVAFHRLSPEAAVHLRDGEILRIGEGTHLHVSLERLQRTNDGPRSRIPALVLMIAAAWAIIPAATSEARTNGKPELAIRLQDARILPARDTTGQWRARANVLVLRGDDPVEGLGAEAFKASLDGKAIPIAAAGTGHESRQPICVALVLDRSGSMLAKARPHGPASRMQVVREAALAFVRLLDPRDQVMIVSFDRNVDVQAPTSDRDRLERAIAQIEPDRWGAGTTNLRGAVERALNELARHRGPDAGLRLALVALTDGAHNVPGAPSPDSLVRSARSIGCPIHAIAYGRTDAPRGSRDWVDVPGLKQLAGEGGGIFQMAPDVAALNDAWGRILRAIRGSYGLELALGRRVPDPYTHVLEVRLAGTTARASGHVSGGMVPSLPGTAGMRLAIWLPMALLLALGGLAVPPGWRRLERLLAPTEHPPPIRSEALALWEAHKKRGAS
ncbi:MAG: vWA domain-containing protein [Candidatus Sericytochromatia bacterium]|nr:vWA domain-containing protein [Candidatus Sericytochromatia bacterium]